MRYIKILGHRSSSRAIEGPEAVLHSLLILGEDVKATVGQHLIHHLQERDGYSWERAQRVSNGTVSHSTTVSLLYTGSHYTTLLRLPSLFCTEPPPRWPFPSLQSCFLIGQLYQGRAASSLSSPIYTELLPHWPFQSVQSCILIGQQYQCSATRTLVSSIGQELPPHWSAPSVQNCSSLTVRCADGLGRCAAGWFRTAPAQAGPGVWSSCGQTETAPRTAPERGQRSTQVTPTNIPLPAPITQSPQVKLTTDTESKVMSQKMRQPKRDKGSPSSLMSFTMSFIKSSGKMA